MAFSFAYLNPYYQQRRANVGKLAGKIQADSVTVARLRHNKSSGGGVCVSLHNLPKA
jgi:hypothetical protein